jgi:hypothetical protein
LLAQEGCEEALLTALDAEESLPVRTLLKDTVLAMVALGAQDGVSWVHMLCSLVTDSPVWRSLAGQEGFDAAELPVSTLQHSESLLERGEDDASSGNEERRGDTGQKHGSIDDGAYAATSLSRGGSWANAQAGGMVCPAQDLHLRSPTALLNIQPLGSSF